MNKKNPRITDHFLAHPEIKQYFEENFNDLLAESDRGAVLLAAQQIDDQLDKFFKSIAPAQLSNRISNRILNYPGPLSSLAAKTDIAYLTRMISKELYDSINALRKIRNKVAHPNQPFSLNSYKEQLSKVYDLGPGVPLGINRMALELLLHSSMQKMMEIKDPTNNDKEYIFETYQEALEYFKKDKELLKIAEEKLCKVELGIGVAIICGLLVHYRGDLNEKLKGNSLICSLNKFEKQNNNV